jgi:hypothetical protein
MPNRSQVRWERGWAARPMSALRSMVSPPRKSGRSYFLGRKVVVHGGGRIFYRRNKGDHGQR